MFEFECVQISVAVRFQQVENSKNKKIEQVPAKQL